jgi:ribonucleoside-diphosphate reductase alpha chain
MNNKPDMNIYVIKRNGKQESVKMEKVLYRIQKQSYNLNSEWVQPFEVAKKVIDGIYSGVSTRELDQLAVETAASMTTKHTDYSILAGRIAISALHKDVIKSFSKTTEKLYNFINFETGEPAPLVSKEYYDIVMKNAEVLDSAIIHSRDFNFDIFGFKTLEKSYLLKTMNKDSKKLIVTETPQFLFMRTAVGIHGNDIDSVIKTYELMSQGYFTHATPTLFNAGTLRPQNSSCFLLQMKDDSIEGIFDTIKDTALISKNAGGIGISISNIRAKSSYIRGTNGKSNGIVPMLKTFNEVARYVDQGGGKRKGSIALYIEPWHDDIFEFLDMKKNIGKEELRARDLFYAIWMTDLFMQRVQKDQMWSLMCPNECPGLQDVYAEDFVNLYTKYEKEGKFRRQVKARDLWSKILESQIETGTPYILYKDSINVKSNQKNIGVIKNSNLCAEIVEYVSPDEIAVCNLASIALPKFIKGRKNKKYDFEKLYDVAYQATVNLNRVIDVNYYPVAQAKTSNMKHRPIGLGTQGLADVFFMFGITYGGEESKKLNIDIFETIYYAALKASNDLAKSEGAYETFKGSPASQGILQFDLWGVTPSDRYDWESLKTDIMKYGLRNSLLTTIMPTASTASIFGNEASCEAQTSNMYTRRVLSGEFIVVNKHLVNELCELNIWNDDIRKKIIRDNGSVQNISEIPDSIKEVYKTVWEISQKDVIDMYADRGAFVDQTQSMNIFMPEPNFAKLTSMHFYGWGNGVTSDLDEENPNPVYGSTPQRALKTGMYYLRSKAATTAVKFTLDNMDAQPQQISSDVVDSQLSCSLDDPDSCLACSA